MKNLESIGSEKFKVISDQEMSHVKGSAGYTIDPVTVTPSGNKLDDFKSDGERKEADGLYISSATIPER